MFAKSIRWRLQLWLGFLLVCILSGFGMTAYQLHRTNQFNQVDEGLKRRVEILANALRSRFGAEPRGGRPPPGRPGPGDWPERRPPHEHRNGTDPNERPGPVPAEFSLPPTLRSLFDETARDSYYFIIWSRTGSVMQSSTNAPDPTLMPPAPAAGTGSFNRTRGRFRESIYFNALGECVLAGRNITTDLAALRRFTLWLLAAGGTVLALGLGGGWWLTTRAIRPVEDISTAATRIADGHLSERITGTDPETELGRLAAVLNDTFARLEAAFAQQKQFTADASHELRTPIAVLIAEAQTVLARERTAAEYRETIEANLATAQQMRQLTESLLTLARLDAGQERLARETFDLADATRACVDLVSPLAAGHGVRLHGDLPPTPCHGDAASLRQVITNLLTNAIHYNHPGGEVHIRTRSSEGAAELTVTDTGIGIAAADQPHLFDRFYRADKSRSRAEGRNGLGLAISKAIVDAHGGRIDLRSELGAGSTFTVRLPG